MMRDRDKIDIQYKLPSYSDFVLSLNRFNEEAQKQPIPTMNLHEKDIMKVFSFYIGQRILLSKTHLAEYDESDINSRIFTLSGVAGSHIQAKETNLWYLAPTYKLNEWKVIHPLVLKGLEQITDEQAIELCQLWYTDEPWAVISRDETCMVLQSGNSYKLWMYFSQEDDFISCEEIYNGAENIEAHGTQCETTSCGNSIIAMIDQLRDWGYALPYKGQDIFELGIAIDEKILQGK